MTEVGLVVIRWVFLTLGATSALLTILIVLLNRMYTSVYPCLILTIQTFSLGICLIDMCYSDSVNCHVSAVFFYFFWMVRRSLTQILNLLTAAIIFAIVLDLHDRRDLIKKAALWVLISVFVVSLGFALAPLNKYERCGSSNGIHFCGNCRGSIWQDLLWASYLVPISCGFAALVLLTITRLRISLRRSKASKRASQAMKILSIPFIWLVLLIANFLVNIFDYNDTPDRTSSSSTVYLLTVLHKLMMLTPVVNLIFFVYMVRNLNELVEVRRIICGRKFLVRNNYEVDHTEQLMA